MGAVPADLVPVRDVAVERVHGGLVGQALEESGVEDDDVRHVGQKPPRHDDPLEMRRIVERSQRAQFFDLGLDGVVDEGGAVEVLAPLDDAMADGSDRAVGQRGADLFEQVDRGLQADSVIGDRPLDFAHTIPVGVADEAVLLPDALDQAGGDGLARVGVDELVFDRGAARIDDEN